MSNEAISNTNAITLDWADVTGATKYWLEVSKTYLDFRSTLVHQDNNLATSTDSFTATGNGKYYWRWRPYIGSWQAPREVNSFIVNTSASADVSATGWTFVNKSDVSDLYLIEYQPINQPINPHDHQWEAIRRNRSGQLRSQHFRTKDRIVIDLTRGSIAGANQKAEILRFYNAHTSFYLITRYDNQTEDDYVYRAWEVLIIETPQLDAPGGNVVVCTEV